MKITEVQVIPVRPVDGLVAFGSCVVDGQLYIGSLGIHKRLDGTGYRITYPTKLIGNRQLSYFNPITKEAGAAIEKAVIEKCVELFERSEEYYGRHSQAAHTSS
jgi:DNA-binding cell septation regulator SpoVG